MDPTPIERKTGELMQYMLPYLKYFAGRSGLDFDDMYQDAAIIVVKCVKRDLLAPIEHIHAYVFRAVQNRMIDTIRARKRREEASLDAYLCTEGNDIESYADIDPACSQYVSEAIARLPPRYQEVVMALATGAKTSDLAEKYNIEYETAKMRAYRARNALRSALQDMNNHE